MSDELIRNLKERIQSLEAENRRLVSRRQKARAEADDLKKQVEDLQGKLDDLVNAADDELNQTAEAWAELEAERDELRTRLEQAPDEKDQRIRELETQARTREYRDRFHDEIGRDLAEGWTVEDVWHHAGFDPTAAETLEADQIRELAGKARDARPGMFAAKGAPEGAENGAGTARRPAPKPLSLGDAGSRGQRDGMSGKVTYRSSELHTTTWQKERPELVKAFAEGNAHCVGE